MTHPDNTSSRDREILQSEAQALLRESGALAWDWPKVALAAMAIARAEERALCEKEGWERAQAYMTPENVLPDFPSTTGGKGE